MEAVAAIGVAAAAVQFFEFSLKTLTLCKQIHDSEKSATDANQELETSIGKLKQITEDLQLNVVLPAVHRPIATARQDCVAAIVDLEKLLEGVKPKSRKRPFATARSAYRAMRSKSKIEALRNKVSEAQGRFLAAASVDTRPTSHDYFKSRARSATRCYKRSSRSFGQPTQHLSPAMPKPTKSSWTSIPTQLPLTIRRIVY